MRPSKFTIYFVDIRTKYRIEILVRLSLFLFAANPDTYAVTYKNLVSAATNYETMGKDLMEEGLITHELCKEILEDHQISIYQCSHVYLILTYYFSSKPH